MGIFVIPAQAIERIRSITSSLERRSRRVVWTRKTDDIPAKSAGVPAPLFEDTVVFNHRQIIGQGDSWTEAIDDWEQQLPTGDIGILVWRDVPEIDCWRDHSYNKQRWQVFCRFSLVDEKQIADATDATELARAS